MSDNTLENMEPKKYFEYEEGEEPTPEEIDAQIGAEAAKEAHEAAVSNDDAVASTAPSDSMVAREWGGVGASDIGKGPEVGYPRSHLPSVGDKDPGGGIVVGTGMRKADDRSWEKDYNAMLQRKAAARAGRQAAADERQRLLDSGMYFDDGRGNIKLKKEFREYKRPVVQGGRIRYYNETRADDGAGMRSIRDASRTAYDTAMGQMVSINREEMNHKEMRDAMAGVKKGEGNLAIYKGLVTALDSLKNSAQTEDETADFSDKATKTITVQLPNGKTEQRSVDPRYDYDQLGRVIGMAPRKKTGLQIQSGFVGRNTINVLNSQLQSMGDDRRITGIIARRKVNPMFPDKASEPFFLVQGVRYDPATKQNVPWGETFDPKRAYELGKTSGKNAGFSDEYSDDNLISTWGDVFGVGARKAAETKAKNAGFEHKRMIDLEKVKTDRLKVIGDIVSQFLKTDASEKADAYILKNLPREAWDALLAPTILKDENGNAVMDETTGKPVMEPLSTEEVFKRMDKATDWAKRAFGRDDNVNLNQPDFISYVMSLAGITPPESVSPAARTAPAAPAKAEGTPKNPEENLNKMMEELEVLKMKRAAMIAAQEKAQASVQKGNKESTPTVSTQPQESSVSTQRQMRSDIPQRESYSLDEAGEMLYGKDLLAQMKSAGGKALREAPKNIPWSETKLRDMPGRALRAIGDAYMKGAEAQRMADEVRAKGSSEAAKAVGRGAASALRKAGEVASRVGNLTPDDLGRLASEYGKATSEGTTARREGLKSVGKRVKRNLDAMDEAHRKYSGDAKSQDRNRFYANRDGRDLPLTEDERTRGKWNEIAERNESDAAAIDEAIEQLRYELNDKERRANNIARVNELIAEANRIRSAKGKDTSAAAKKKAVKALAVARDAQRIYESGDIDAVRKSIADDAEIMAITDEFNQMYDELMGVEE